MLRTAQLVEVRREGKSRIYRLGGDDVSALWVALRDLAESHLAELQLAMQRLFEEPERLTPENAPSLLEKVRAG